MKPSCHVNDKLCSYTIVDIWLAQELNSGQIIDIWAIHHVFTLGTLSQGETVILGRSARCAISAFFQLWNKNITTKCARNPYLS